MRAAAEEEEKGEEEKEKQEDGAEEEEAEEAEESEAEAEAEENEKEAEVEEYCIACLVRGSRRHRRVRKGTNSAGERHEKRRAKSIKNRISVSKEKSEERI